LKCFGINHRGKQVAIKILTDRSLEEGGITTGKKNRQYLQTHHGFPAGFFLTPRNWAVEEAQVEDWLANRPLRAPCNIPAEKRPRGRPRNQASSEHTPI
jgi:hypothetical protein